jgi:hypothetical protein
MHRVGILQMLGILDTLTSIYTCRECTRNMHSFLRFSWVHFREGLHLYTPCTLGEHETLVWHM